MSLKISTAAARISANAAAVASAMGEGTDPNDVTKLAALLSVMAMTPSVAIPLMKLLPLSQAQGLITE